MESGFWISNEIPKLVANGRYEEFVKFIQKDLQANGDKMFRSNLGTIFKLADWKDALKIYKNGNARKLFFKLI